LLLENLLQSESPVGAPHRLGCGSFELGTYQYRNLTGLRIKHCQGLKIGTFVENHHTSDCKLSIL
jgi:hypothetical protein